MGCVHDTHTQDYSRGQILEALNAQKRDNNSDFKTYAEHHTLHQKRKSLLLKNSTMFDQKININHLPQTTSRKQLCKNKEGSPLMPNKPLRSPRAQLAKVPSKEQNENDVAFVDGRLIFLKEERKLSSEQDESLLLKTLKDNGIAVSDLLSGNREEILRSIEEKDMKRERERREKITNEYFNDETIEVKIHSV